MTKVYRRIYMGFFLVAITAMLLNFIYIWWRGNKEMKVPFSVTKSSKATEVSPKSRKRSDYEVIVSRNLFAGSEFFDEETGDAKTSNLPETALRLRLASTIISSSGKALAVIEDQSRRKQKIYREGDVLEIRGQKSKVKVAKIERFRVVLEHNGKQEVLKMFEKVTHATTRRRYPPSSMRARRARRRRVPIRKPPEIPLMGEQPPEASGPDSPFSKRSRASHVGAAAKFYPVREGSEVVGLRIRHIRPGSPFRKIGLIEGDIIKSVNGQAVSENSDVDSLKEIIENKEPFEIEIKRRGRTIKKSLESY